MIRVAPSPHIARSNMTTQSVMRDVLIALAPVVGSAIYFFGTAALIHIIICTVSCLVFEIIFTRMRKRPVTLNDFSVSITGIIIALSLPWTAPWYIDVIACLAGVGIGKTCFGGLGQNFFNPAMVGRAFVMIAFSQAMGAGAYVDPHAAITITTQATPLGGLPHEPLALFLGQHNGSLGETSILASIIGGIYLWWRRSASWEISISLLASLAALAWAGSFINNPALPGLALGIEGHLMSGAAVFAAMFIATDPVTSPMSKRGKFIFGAGIGILIWVLRVLSGYPEGVMFAVLIMNSTVPLINRWSIPLPVGVTQKPAQEKGDAA